MNFRRLFAPARPVRRALFAATAVAALLAGSAVVAQQPPAAPPAPPAAPKAPAKTPPKKAPAQAPAPPQQPAQAPPAAPPAGPPAAPPAAGPAPAAGPPAEQQLPVIYSPWTKFCGKDQNQPNAKEVCLTVKEARLETGQFVAGAALIEQEGEVRKILRITLPLGMQLVHGTRLLLDQSPPMMGRYVVCLPNGCMADFEVNQDFVAAMKKGQQIVLQGINLPGQAASYPLPLVDFAKANEGPPTDPKVFEEQQRKLQEELQRRADEARRRLQERAPNAPPPTTPPANPAPPPTKQ